MANFLVFHYLRQILTVWLLLFLHRILKQQILIKNSNDKKYYKTENTQFYNFTVVTINFEMIKRKKKHEKCLVHVCNMYIENVSF